MGSTFSKGKVIEGEYKGYEVHATESSQLSLFSVFEAKDRHIRSGKLKPIAVIDKNTIRNIEHTLETTKGSSAADVGGAALLFGPLAGAIMYADGQQSMHYIRVTFNNGKSSLLKVKHELLDVVMNISFELERKKSEPRVEIIDEPGSEQKQEPVENEPINPKQLLYDKAKQYMNEGSFFNAYTYFSSLSGFMDADNLARICEDKYKEEERSTEQEKKEKTTFSKQIDGVLKERNDLLYQLIDQPDNDAGLQYVKYLESELLDYAGIRAKSEDVYSFDAFTNIKRIKKLMDTEKEEVFNGYNEWFVVARKGNYLLMLSKYCEKNKVLSARLNMKDLYEWRISNVRDLLVSGFYVEATKYHDPFIKAFSQRHIDLFVSPKTVLGGNYPDDLVYILSKAEVEEYLNDASLRKVSDKKTPKEYLPWILRSDTPTKTVDIVKADGTFGSEKVRTLMNGVYRDASLRPALWIDLDKIK